MKKLIKALKERGLEQTKLTRPRYHTYAKEKSDFIVQQIGDELQVKIKFENIDILKEVITDLGLVIRGHSVEQKGYEVIYWVKQTF